MILTSSDKRRIGVIAVRGVTTNNPEVIAARREAAGYSLLQERKRVIGLVEKYKLEYFYLGNYSAIKDFVKELKREK